MVKMGEITTYDNITTKVGEVVIYIHCYEGDKFSIHVCNQAMNGLVLISLRWKNLFFLV